jgi:uncharacterized membrane protein
MDTANPELANEPAFHAVLTPHRSLGPRGFKILMAVLIGSWIFAGLVFVSMGAWPIFGFFGLDVVAIYIAFRFNYRSANCREEVRLSRDELTIQRTEVSGRTLASRFNPLWTRLHVAKHPYAGVTSIAVASRGKRVTVGDFLNPDDRASFANAFGQALATVKRS